MRYSSRWKLSTSHEDFRVCGRLSNTENFRKYSNRRSCLYSANWMSKGIHFVVWVPWRATIMMSYIKKHQSYDHHDETELGYVYIVHHHVKIAIFKLNGTFLEFGWWERCITVIAAYGIELVVSISISYIYDLLCWMLLWMGFGRFRSEQ